MKNFRFSIPLAIGLILCGCGRNNSDNQVISKRYIHKYGYAVSQSEWDNNNYPGQVLTSLRDGVTITATYENGTLHGPTTHTHPHSQTIKNYYLYNFGELKKEVSYDVLGMPVEENVQLSPHRHCITKWYGDGTPMSIEDFADNELLDAKYFTLGNEVESTVERGMGLRTIRDQNGILLAKDHFDSGYLTRRETFYASGSPESMAHFHFNKKSGERFVFAENGNPLAEEEWVENQLHGKATYYTNGKKQTEVFFINGARNGIETHFIDGEQIEQEIHWIYDRRHGPTKFYVGDNVAKTEWYYDGKHVSKRQFDEFDQMDQMITQASSGFNESSTR